MFKLIVHILKTCSIFTESNRYKKTNIMKTINEMEAYLRSINFFVGGLTDEGIEYYYNLKTAK